MTNKEILDKLLTRETDKGAESFEGSHYSYNAHMVKKYLANWDVNESKFPIKKVRQYIRLNEWTRLDFDIRTELLLQQLLPKWFMLIFIRMKQFRSNSRNELTSIEQGFGKMMGYPMKTQDEKAFVAYDACYQKFINTTE